MTQLLKPLEALNDAYVFEKLSAFCIPNYWSGAKICINEHFRVYADNWGHHEINISYWGEYHTLNFFLQTIHEIDPCVKCNSWQYDFNLQCEEIKLIIYPSDIGSWLIDFLRRMMM